MPNSKDIDIVYELMLRQRDLPLSESLEKLSQLGNRTYFYASSYIVCLETKITEELISKLSDSIHYQLNLFLEILLLKTIFH